MFWSAIFEWVMITQVMNSATLSLSLSLSLYIYIYIYIYIYKLDRGGYSFPHRL
jgi:hypothetical protein